MNNIDRLLKCILVVIALTLLIPICFSQTPVEIRKQPIQVYGFATNSSGQLFVIPLGVQTNAIIGGLVGISNWPSAWGITNLTGVPIAVTGNVGQAGAPWSFTGAVSQLGAPWLVSGNMTNTPSGTQAVSQSGAPWTVTEGSAAAILSALQNVTNNTAPYTVQMFWNSGATIGSNVFSSSACTIGPIVAFNTNNSPVQLSFYNVSSGTTLGSTNNMIWSGPVPAGFTNSAGYAINLGGFRCTSGLIGVVTGAGNTNGAPAGPLWINGALKP